MKIHNPQDEQLYTYEDYMNWPEDERWELIYGVPYNMSPAPGRLHQEVLARLNQVFRNFFPFDARCQLYFAPLDVRLFQDKVDKKDKKRWNTVVQPDLMVVCDPEKMDDKGIKGAPDLVVEINSPYHPNRDYLIKRDLYEKAGVPQYWIIEPASRSVVILELSDGKLIQTAEYKDDQIVTVNGFEGFTVSLAELFPTTEKKEPTRPSPLQSKRESIQ